MTPCDCEDIDAWTRESYAACEDPSCDVCRKYRRLKQQIARTKVHLDAMIEEFRELRPEINEVHKSPIDRLPPEIISAIFEHYVSQPLGDIRSVRKDYAASPGGLTLGAVCQNWRQIAWSTSSLWTTLVFKFSKTTSRVRVELAVEWLQRSGRLPVSIFFWTNDVISDFKQEIPVAIRLILAINHCSDRWYSLSLSLPPSFMSLICDAKGGSPVMQRLQVEPHNLASLEIPKTAPRDIDISTIPLGELSMMWHEVTSVSATDFYTVCDCLQILNQASNIKQGTFSPWYRGAIDNTFQQVTNTHLTSLNIMFHEGPETIASFFDNVKLPALSIFTLQLKCEEAPIRSLVSFLQRSGCKLESFAILNALVTGQELVELTKSMPSVSYLKLHSWIPDITNEVLQPFYQSLSPHSTGAHGAPGPRLLPCLKKLDLGGCFTFPDQLVTSLVSLVDSLDHASLRRLENVDIMCRDPAARIPVPCIARPTLERILYLQRQGIKFNVHTMRKHRRQDLLKLSLERHGIGSGIASGGGDSTIPTS